jgi:hypothetical protein
MRKIAGVSVLGLAALLGTSASATAQDRWGSRTQDMNTIEQQRIDRQRISVDDQRMPIERQDAWRNGSDRSNGYGYNSGVTNDDRYRVYRNGSYYNTDRNGAELLRQAVNTGYQQGFQAGVQDSRNRRRSSWSNSNMYRSGTYGYQSYVDRSQYQYYFQQGFQRGYQDGLNSGRRNGYNNGYSNGYSNGGSVNILGTILNQLLNIRQY